MIAEVLGGVFNPQIFLYLVLGVISGICIGALPGLTATMGVALLLPLTFGLSASAGLLMLLGVYVGAIYGGSISAVLLHTPGTPASAATALDGYEMSKRGESGRALGIVTLSSLIGGIESSLALILISPQLAKLALNFTASDFFMLAIFGLTIIVSISGKSIAKGLICGGFGMFLASVGIDPITGCYRFTFNSVDLTAGISFIPVMIGLFAMSQAFVSIVTIYQKESHPQKLTRVLPTKKDLKVIFHTAPFTGLIGILIGIIPGAGADIGAFVSYNEAKRFSKHPEKFGTGIPEAVSAPEGGNNGVTGGALIPMLTLGIPGDSVAAIMIGALTIQGLQPGPLLFSKHQTLVYTIFAGFFVANIIMALFGFSCMKLFTKILSIPKAVLVPIIFLLCIVGSYAINNSFFDVCVMMFSGVVGYFMEKVKIPTSPAVLGLILGPLAESNFRRALVMSGGKSSIFFQSPISVFFLILILVTLFTPALRSILSKGKAKNIPVV